jgi:hypothetical protein
MTARTRSRTFLVGAAVAALAAPLAAIALSAPAEAKGNVGPRKHEVTMYKVEKHVDLSGEYPDNYVSTSLSCSTGDIVLDGMWRVDHVDQVNTSDVDPDDPSSSFYGDERDVVVYASYPDSVDSRKWNFRLEDVSEGNAQVKLFVTCIKGATEATANHKHGIEVSGVFSNPTSDNFGVGHNPLDFGSSCAPGYFAVAPGFNFVDDDDNRLFRSWPTSTFRGWQWAFTVAAPHPNVDVYLKCINKKVVQALGPGASKKHSHKIPMAFKPGYAGFATSVWGPHAAIERTYSCDQDDSRYHAYKAMVGGFWIDDPDHTWFLGMDPRPKSRAYRFWYDNAGSNSVYLGALCIKSRTDKQIKP